MKHGRLGGAKGHDHNPRSSYPRLGLKERADKETLSVEGRGARPIPVLVSAYNDDDDGDNDTESGDTVHNDTHYKSDKTKCDQRKSKNLASLCTSQLQSFTWNASHLGLIALRPNYDYVLY